MPKQIAALVRQEISRVTGSLLHVRPKRNSPNDIKEIDDLNRLGEIVVDKRNGKRADAKKSRRKSG